MQLDKHDSTKGPILENMNRAVFGSIVKVSVPSLGLEDIIAKVDTGAWSGAMHCTNIHQQDGLLSYMPLGNQDKIVQTTDYEYRLVRSANGHAAKRFIVPVELTIEGRSYQTKLGLSDRTVMQREMLLGRRFLIENKILIDVLLTLEDDQEAERYL